MTEWESFTGEDILDNITTEESSLETVINQGIAQSSNNECVLFKLYYTDGFGWYFDGNDITFIIHECKIGKTVGKTIVGHLTCLKKALLQAIGYYFKLTSGKITKFSPKLNKLSEKFGYDNVNKFIADKFGMFLITTDKFICNVKVDDYMKGFLNEIEPLIESTEYSPSKYWDDDNLKKVMNKFDITQIHLDFMPDEVDLKDTGTILNKILNDSNSII